MPIKHKKEKISKRQVEKISTILIEAVTTSDNKEDAQFEVQVKQGSETTLNHKVGAGENPLC